ncbi:hypothetical protein KJA16_00580 [Patescibacteria group bacterium]|nr:hypothetical protein [Patescibacteria group bacterium]
MKKLILFGVIVVFLATLAGTAMAQPGPWKSKNKKLKVIPYTNGETLLRLWTGDDGFQLWITGNRELHCVYKLEGQNDGDGWLSSSWMPGYMYKCEAYE